MALDRQKILNELGSVMNQLKSTDCGCMGKLFGDSVQNVTQTGNIPTCGRHMQGCGNSHNHGCSNSMPNNGHNFYPSCVSQCNPTKLYADTYNYLNENLMQPTVNEVYNELKSITPANTIMNNPLAQQMGLSNQKNFMQPSVEKQNVLSNLNTCNTVGAGSINSNMNMGQMGGMGPQIMNMFGENQGSKSNSMVHQAKPGAILTDNQYNYNENTALIGNPQNTNHVSHQLKQQSTGNNCQPVGNVNTNVGPPQQTRSNNHHYHGQHAQGMETFKKMFPEAMKNDLGFDPMEIAIQMNPENQKKVAVNTLHKMINNNNISSTLKTNDTSAVVHPGLNGSINNNQYIAQPNQQGNVFPNDVLQSNVLHQQANPQMNFHQQPVINTAQINSQPIMSNGQVPQPFIDTHGANTGLTNINTYTSLPTSPLPNQQVQSPYYQQSIIDANLNVNGHSNQSEILNARQVIKEPILPADKTKFVMPQQKYCEFNTLGQPIEMLPAKIYHTPVPGLPQTLSPQVSASLKNDFKKYSNVKSTMSKTSLMGNKPIGTTPSRNQLQHIYNQYKGSQSFTNQSIKNPFNRDISRSDGRLNVPHVNLTEQHLPIENIGGDTAANNRLNNERVNKMGHVTEQIGDAPIIKQSNNGPEKLSPVTTNRKCRNGLQDMVYTSYTTSAAWSFHGYGRAAPPSAGYRYRNKS